MMTLFKDDQMDTTVIGTSSRFKYFGPSKTRDEAVHALYNDAEAMLPHLPMLFGMSIQDVEARRNTQRCTFAKESMFLDVVSEGGELVAVAGFRDIVGDRAEWGIIVAPAFRRQRVCEEVFQANMTLLKGDVLQRSTVRAATTEANDVMIRFLEKRMKRTGETIGGTWVVFEADVDVSIKNEA